MEKKTILHLCADIGSDSWFYQNDPDYEVIMIGEEIGVENYSPDRKIHGIIANPVCTEFSTANGFHKKREPDLSILEHCRRIIKESNPLWWVIENPATGTMKKILGDPDMVYQPWEYGSPWTKKTALWGNFNHPEKIYWRWNDLFEFAKSDKLYIKKGRKKPGLSDLHKSAIEHIPEFHKFRDRIKNDADFRSLCSQGFAKAFYEANP